MTFFPYQPAFSIFSVFDKCCVDPSRPPVIIDRSYQSGLAVHIRFAPKADHWVRQVPARALCRVAHSTSQTSSSRLLPNRILCRDIAEMCCSPIVGNNGGWVETLLRPSKLPTHREFAQARANGSNITKVRS